MCKEVIFVEFETINGTYAYFAGSSLEFILEDVKENFGFSKIPGSIRVLDQNDMVEKSFCHSPHCDDCINIVLDTSMPISYFIGEVSIPHKERAL